MKLQSFYSVIGTDKIEESKAFYLTHFSFEITFDSDWYVSLRTQDAKFQLALLDYRHPSVPAGYRQAAQGVILNFEVEDVDAAYQRLIKEAGLPVALDIRTEDWGQRHFLTVDPNGILIDLITITPPSAEFLKQYTEAGKAELLG
ncbi:MAG TPA: VOC family protein [Anaerolineae bacterium]|nr:VOC family protein [Anaerolineae bacterium]